MSELFSIVALGLTLVTLHISIPLAYYAFLKQYFTKPWTVKFDPEFKPLITIIVPTFNEAQLIERKLRNLGSQDYPRDRVEILVIDSGSADNTVGIVEEWIKNNGRTNAKLIHEVARRGKFKAVSYAIERARLDSVVVVITDADTYCEPSALSGMISFLADPDVGAVSGSMVYVDDLGSPLRDTYRNYFNSVRVAESKVHSTPIHNGQMLAIRASLLRTIGLPDFPGSDDSAFGSLFALAGHRAIQVDSVVVGESQRGNRIRVMVRRAQHLLLNFLRTRNYAKRANLYVRSSFDRIWWIEWWLNLVNPWLLLAGIILLAFGAVSYRSQLAIGVLTIGVVSLLIRPYRMWLIQQIYLLIAALRNLWTSEVTWKR